MNESTSRLVTTHRARARSSRPLSPFHRARRASRDRIDDRGTESTTEGLNRRVRARITRNAMISTRDASIVPFKRSCRSKRSFVHVIARSSRSSRSSRSPARVVIHSFTHVMHARHAFVAARVGVTHDESRLIIPLFVSFSFSKRAQKKIKKINTRAKSTRDPHGGEVHTSHDPTYREEHLPRSRAREIQK